MLLLFLKQYTGNKIQHSYSSVSVDKVNLQEIGTFQTHVAMNALIKAHGNLSILNSLCICSTQSVCLQWKKIHKNRLKNNEYAIICDIYTVIYINVVLILLIVEIS